MSKSGNILIVARETTAWEQVARALRQGGFEVTAAPVEDAIGAVRAAEFDVALIRMKPGEASRQEVERLRLADPDLLFVFLPPPGNQIASSLFPGSAFIYRGAFMEELLSVVSAAASHRRARRSVALQAVTICHYAPLPALVCQSPEMQRVRALATSAAGAQSPVLITGEPGTGKEVVARVIHASGAHRSQALATIDCGSPGSLAEDTLRHAVGGALLLDCVNRLPFHEQENLLRRMTDESAGARIRWLATTDDDLLALTRSGAFLPDLYRALRGYIIAVPPLRQRAADLPELTEQVLQQLCRRMSRPVPPASPQLIEHLAAYPWPGNLRELANVLERALMRRAPAEEIRPEDLMLERKLVRGARRQTLAEVEQNYIEQIWRESDGNHSRAARILGIDRTTLYNKLRRYGLKVS